MYKYIYKHKLNIFNFMTKPCISQIEKKKDTKCYTAALTTFSLFSSIKSTFQECAGVSAVCPFLKFTAAFSKAIFFSLSCSLAFVNTSAKGIGPQLYFPFPQKTNNAISCNSPSLRLSSTFTTQR